MSFSTHRTQFQQIKLLTNILFPIYLSMRSVMGRLETINDILEINKQIQLNVIT